jgi:NADH-quinone oxidoreductase subunit M
MLAWTIYLSFAGAIILWFNPRATVRAARAAAMTTALACLALSLLGFVHGRLAGFQTIVQVSWIADLGIDYYLCADGISLTLVLLTGLASVAGLLFSWNIEERAHQFYALYLALVGGVYGVFLSFDVFLLFVFYEIAIIPKYFLIAIWGSKNREYAAMKLALYSFGGSAMVLAALLATYVAAGSHSTSLPVLAKFPFPETFQFWIFPLMFVGFGILAGLWPFHTWAPTGHVAAPTAASMLLAGVVMKLGAYGCLRVAMTLFPLGFQAWHQTIGVLAVIGIIYGAVVALAQNDFKFVIGYSSVSHMGFVLLGFATLTEVGLNGAILQMFSHGIIAGILFAVVGRMVYDRTHTRDLGILQQMSLATAIPFAAVAFTIASLASMGMPGFSGFIAELHVITGAWQASPWFAVFAGAGILLAVGYSLRTLQLAFLSAPGEVAQVPAGIPSAREFSPISVPERLGSFLLISVAVIVGVFPRILLDAIVSSLASPVFDGLRTVLWKG